MKLSLLSLIVIGAMSTVANADTKSKAPASTSGAASNNVHSDYFYQPNGGQNAVTPALQYAFTKTEFLGTTDNETKKAIITRYAYGFTNDYALSVDVGYETTKPKSGDTAKGLMDIDLWLLGRAVFTGFNFRYGVDLNYSPQKAKVDTAGDATNSFSGQHKAIPFIGLEVPIQSFYVGGRFVQEFNLSDKVKEDNTGAETKTSGGEQTAYSLFTEWRGQSTSLGLDLNYLTYKDTKNKATGVKSQAFSPIWLLHGYGVFYVTDSIALIPQFALMQGKDEISGIDVKLKSHFINFSARFTF